MVPEKAREGWSIIVTDCSPWIIQWQHELRVSILETAAVVVVVEVVVVELVEVVEPAVVEEVVVVWAYDTK